MHQLPEKCTECDLVTIWIWSRISISNWICSHFQLTWDFANSAEFNVLREMLQSIFNCHYVHVHRELDSQWIQKIIFDLVVSLWTFVAVDHMSSWFVTSFNETEKSIHPVRIIYKSSQEQNNQQSVRILSSVLSGFPAPPVFVPPSMLDRLVIKHLVELPKSVIRFEWVRWLNMDPNGQWIKWSWDTEELCFL